MKTVPAILKAWLNFISFVERNRTSVIWDEESCATATALELVENRLLIKEPKQIVLLFEKLLNKYAAKDLSELYEELQASQSILAVTWPMVWTVKKESAASSIRISYPLFFIDITESLFDVYSELLDGEYEDEIDVEIDLLTQKPSPVTEQLLFILGLDLEEVERKTLFAETPIDFLASLLIPEASSFSLQESVSLIVRNWGKPIKQKGLELRPQPYIFELEYSEHEALRKELWNLFSSARERESFVDKNSAAGAFLSFHIEKKPSKRPLSYGLCQGKTPDEEQLDIFRLYDSVALCPVLGPPGTGKTFLTREILAQELVKKALRISSGEEPVGLFIVSSSVNRAIDNVVDFFRNSHDRLGIALNLTADPSEIQEVVQRQIEELRSDSYDEEEFERSKKKLNELKEKIDSYLREIEKELPEKEQEREKLQSLLTQVEARVLETRRKLQQVNALLKPFHSERHFIQYYLYLQSLYYRIQSVRTSILAAILKPLARWYEGKLLQEAQDELAKIAIPLQMSDITTYEALEEAFSKLRLIEQAILHRKDLELLYEKYRSEANSVRKRLEILEEEVKKLQQIEVEKRLKEAYRSKQFLEWNLEMFQVSLDVLWQYALFHKTRVSEFLILLRDALVGIRNLDSREAREAVYMFEKDARETLYWTSQVFPILCANLLSFSEAFPFLLPELFDLAIIDEAAYVEPHFAFPVLYRSRRAVLSGDNRQLRPPRNLTLAQAEEYHRLSFSDQKLIENFSPVNVTALDRAAKAISGTSSIEDGFFGKLRVCRRSHPNIVKFFSKIGGYNLLSEAQEPEEIKKVVESFCPERIGYVRVEAPQRGAWTENIKEVEAAVAVVDWLIQKGFKKEDIAVITPYVRQERLLYHALKDKISRENIGTVHKFQGREATVVVFSSVVWNPDHRKIFFSSGSNLLNTAVSRAKSLFICVGVIDVLLEAPRWVKVFADALLKMGRELEIKVNGEAEIVKKSLEEAQKEEIEESKKKLKKLSETTYEQRKKQKSTKSKKPLRLLLKPKKED